MNNLLHNILEYKKIHPLRFWLFLLIIIILLLIVYFNIYKFFKLNKTKRRRRKKRSTYKKLKNHKLKIALFAVITSLIIIASYAIYLKHIVVERQPITDSKYVFGIDISSYQGRINWEQVQHSKHPIKFVFVRATMGKNGKDKYFNYNWKNIKKYNYIWGAYHYYRPYENSTKQFYNYSSVVNKNEKNFIPILDIEKPSIFGKKNLRKGVLNWLKLAEEYYGVKPVIYTGLTFYLKNLKGYVDDYPLWIAAYSGKHRLVDIDWDFHQFTEKVYVKGIKTSVDGNDFNGSISELKAMCN